MATSVIRGEIKVTKKIRKWAVQFPDGSIPGQYFYENRSDIVALCPAALYGDMSTWSRALKDGYKIRRVEIEVVR